MLFVVAYDIPDDARRTRVAKELENWGQRAQYSVFECDLDAARADAMVERLRGLTEPEDQVRVYRLCEACVRESVSVRGGGFARDPDFYQV
jgi:CRISPR-associated protein Cas2